MLMEEGRQANNRRRAAAMENRDDLEEVPLEDIPNEGDNAMYPIGEANLPGQVVVEAEIASPRMDLSDDTSSSEEEAIAAASQ